MIDTLANQIVKLGVKNERIAKAQEDVYLYGYTILIETLICAMFSLIITFFLDKVIELLLFSACFIPLRCFGGGYHATTAKKCLIISTLMIVLFCILIGYEAVINQNLRFIIIVITGTIIVFMFAPQIRYSNISLERRCKLAVRIIYILSLSLASILYFYNLHKGSTCILLAQISWLLSLITDLLRRS